MSYRLHCNVENPHLLTRTMLKAKALAWSAKVFTMLAMSSTLTVDLDAEVMRLAEQEAEAHKTTLVRVVERQLEVMAQNRRNSVAGKTPITDQLRGVISLPASDDYRELVAEELQKNMAGKDRLFLDADVTLDHLSDRQPFAESAHRLFAMAETGEVQIFVSALTFSHLYFLLKKGRTRAETLSLLTTLKRITTVAAVGDKEIQSALVSSFGDFEDAIQHFSAKGDPGIHAIITRNKADFSLSEIPVLSPDEYLVQFAARLPGAKE